MYDTRTATVIGGWLILAFGLILSIGNLPGLNPYLDRLLDLVIWQKDHGSYLTVTEARLVVAVTGGIACAWGVLQIGLARSFGTTHPDALRRIVIRGYWVWFLVDGAGSVLAGAPLNILGNTAFLAVLLLPFARRPNGAAEDVRTP